MPEIFGMTTIQEIQFAAMFIAILVASWRQQFQALFYLLAVLYAVQTWPQFALANFIMLIGLYGSGLIRGSGAGKD